MPRNNEYDEFDDEDEFEEQNVPKDLRRALNKANKQNAELAKQVEDLMRQVKTQSLANILNEKKIPAKIQRWIKRDEVEASPEAVQKWLDENGEDFGYEPESEKPVETPAAPQVPAPQQQGVLTPEDAAQLQRLQAMGQAPADPPAIDPMKAKVDQVANAINVDTDFDAVARALKAAGIPIESQMSF